MPTFYPFEEAPIRLTARGEWFHGNDRMHPRVADLFSRSITLDDEERYIIKLRWQTAPFEVEDAPYFVRACWPDRETQGGIRGVQIKVSDGREEALDPSTLMQSEDHVLYCRIRRGDYALPCRFSPQQYHDLATAAEDTPDGFVLRIRDRVYPIGAYDPRPVRVAETGGSP